jgi:NAD(P)-dependent dehydrogenase (short-subunit alcohol dehydrogenase family)
MNGLHQTREACQNINPKVKVVCAECNVAEDSSVKAMVSLAVKEFGRIDYAINCAGFPGLFSISTEYPIEQFDKVQQVNVRGTWLCQKYELSQMEKQEPTTRFVTSLSILIQR